MLGGDKSEPGRRIYEHYNSNREVDARCGCAAIFAQTNRRDYFAAGPDDSNQLEIAREFQLRDACGGVFGPDQCAAAAELINLICPRDSKPCLPIAGGRDKRNA